ncbi:MAG: T9SS type A sorting domain-containing protein, partial [Bacteroidetes bacterium]|nr:T9SS type A sorting domain-containing protein [Bacteroidota bacterium]
LTFRFHSDYHNIYPGWAAKLKCIGGSLSLIANSFPANVCLGSSSQLVAIVNGGTGNCSYQWSPATYLDDPTSATPVSTPESDITYTVTIIDGLNTLTSDPVTLTALPRPQAPTVSLNGLLLTSSNASGNQWYINGNLIPNATGQTYAPTASGDYTATYTNTPGGCESAHSNLVTWLITGVNNTPQDAMVQIYPNPAHGELTITMPAMDAGMISIAICDAAGHELIKQHHQANQPPADNMIRIDLSHLSTGVYYCAVQTDKIKTVKKVIITK